MTRMDANKRHCFELLGCLAALGFCLAELVLLAQKPITLNVVAQAGVIGTMMFIIISEILYSLRRYDKAAEAKREARERRYISLYTLVIATVIIVAAWQLVIATSCIIKMIVTAPWNGRATMVIGQLVNWTLAYYMLFAIMAVVVIKERFDELSYKLRVLRILQNEATDISEEGACAVGD